MKTATAQDWKTEPLPDKHIVVRLNLSYSKNERQKIVKGAIPEQMEDKWFVYYDQGVLNFHRSWTGFCVYRVHTEDNCGELNLTYAQVNRDREQYSETDDDFDRRMIPYLIDLLLLKKPAHSPAGNRSDKDVLKMWSSVGKALFNVAPKEMSSADFIRIVPAQRFTGFPAPSHRPYAFYADAASLNGKSVAESYSLVKGLNLSSLESSKGLCSPFIWVHHGDQDGPLVNLKVNGNDIIFGELPLESLDAEKFVVLRVSRSAAVRNLDVFPATWKALSYIVSDPVRMGAREPGWDMSLDHYASARIHALFREVQADGEFGLLALKKTKDGLELSDLDRLPKESEERDYYSYLSRDSAFTDQIVELFGISSRCWHGCGYIGMPGKPVCRFFLLRNKITPYVRVSVLKGDAILKY